MACPKMSRLHVGRRRHGCSRSSSRTTRATGSSSSATTAGSTSTSTSTTTRPGTDDGAAAFDHAFAPGLDPGPAGEPGPAHRLRRRLRQRRGRRFRTCTSRPARRCRRGRRSSPGRGPRPRPSNPSTPRAADAEACDRWTPFLSVEELVTRQYLDFYERTPDGAGLGYWTGQLTANRLTPHQFIGQLLTAPEFAERISPVARLYKAFFRRTPDSLGLTYWVGEYSRGTSLDGDGAGLRRQPRVRRHLRLARRRRLRRPRVRQRARPGARRRPGAATGSTSSTGGLARGGLMALFSESAENQARTDDVGEGRPRLRRHARAGAGRRRPRRTGSTQNAARARLGVLGLRRVPPRIAAFRAAGTSALQT